MRDGTNGKDGVAVARPCRARRADPSLVAKDRSTKGIRDRTRPKPVVTKDQRWAGRDSAVERPTRWLAGFSLVDVSPGQEITVDVTIPARSLAHWDRDLHAWTMELGVFHLAVGRSYSDQRLTTQVAVARTHGNPPG
jgi:Fibronectin type III-like domain